MQATEDPHIGNYAKENSLIIVSKDSDMHDLSLMFGMPPKVIRVRLGNCSTAEVANLLRTDFNVIKMFAEDSEVSLLVLP